jgi:hypothetical protein
MSMSVRRLTASELHGQGSDMSMLLDADLRARLLKYGDLAQATYDGFDRHSGACRHDLRRLLPALGLAGHRYQVTKFVYATCDVGAWEGHANWIGYVAVTGAAEAGRVGYREIVVAWRGTISAREWLLDMKTEMVPFEIDASEKKDDGAMVAKGFHSIYTSKNPKTRHGERSAREQVDGEIKRLVTHFRDEHGEVVRVTITGHSLGGALALLAARDVAAAHPDVPVAAVTFSAPRVGNGAFRDGLASRGVRVLRVVVRGDVVPSVPSVPKAPVVNAAFSRPLAKVWKLAGRSPEWAYVHAGDVLELDLDVTQSSFRKHAHDLVRFHSLDTCLRLLAGRESDAGEFRVMHDGRAHREFKLRMLVMGKWEEDDLPVQDDQLPLSELDDVTLHTLRDGDLGT